MGYSPMSAQDVSFHSTNQAPSLARMAKGLGQSHSTGSIVSHPYVDPFTAASTYNVDEMFATGNESSRRGRSTSPVKHYKVKYLDDVEEGDEENMWKSPTKRSRSPMKKMFGENGWLGRSSSLREISSEYNKKPTGLKQWSGKIKQRVGGLVSVSSTLEYALDLMLTGWYHQTEDMTHLLESPFYQKPKSQPPSTFPISMSPYAQSVLTSQIELMVTVTANRFLLIQHEHGRMSPESLTKVLEFWKSKGRPQVIEFHFDQATQRDLIVSNLKTFRFFGRHAGEPVAVSV